MDAGLILYIYTYICPLVSHCSELILYEICFRHSVDEWLGPFLVLKNMALFRTRSLNVYLTSHILHLKSKTAANWNMASSCPTARMVFVVAINDHRSLKGWNQQP